MDAIEFYFWYRTTGNDLKSSQFELAFKSTQLFELIKQTIDRQAYRCNLNSYTYLILQRYLLCDTMNRTILLRAILLECCLRLDKNKDSEVSDILTMFNMENDMVRFLESCHFSNRTYVQSLTLYKEL